MNLLKTLKKNVCWVSRCVFQQFLKHRISLAFSFQQKIIKKHWAINERHHCKEFTSFNSRKEIESYFRFWDVMLVRIFLYIRVIQVFGKPEKRERERSTSRKIDGPFFVVKCFRVRSSAILLCPETG